jgi:hypothetical protein
MLAYDGIEFLDLHLFRHGALILGRGVEVTSFGGGYESDFFTHNVTPLYLLATCTHVGQDSIDAFLVDNAQAFCAQAQFYPAVFTFYPDAARMQVGQKTTFGLVVGMGNIVTCDGAFPGYLTNSRHCFLQKISDWCDKGREIYQLGRRESSVLRFSLLRWPI